MDGFLTGEQITVLREAHYSCRQKKAADRIKAVLLLNDGFGYDEVAAILMLDTTTIRRYEKQFHTLGVDGLLECRYFGSHGRLSKLQETGLITHLRHTTYRTVLEIAAYVKTHYRHSYSIEGMTHLLHRLGFAYKKMKRVPGNYDPRKQEAFMMAYTELKTTKGEKDRIYFLDSTHPTHNSLPAYGWIYKGTVKTVKGNAGRRRLNLNGALNLEDMEATVLEEETVNTQAVITLSQKLERAQPEGDLYLIMDNAPQNRSKELQAFLKDHPRLKPFYLPCYSPNLNVIERLWLFFHKKVLYNRYYETFPQFKRKCLRFFHTLGKYRPELQTLLTDSFQTLPV